MRQFLHHIRIVLILIAASFSLQCQEKGDFNPVGPPVRTIQISGLTATPDHIAAGGGESTISGRITDQDDSPYSGTKVTFRALHGSIDSTDTTDSLGVFSARYIAGDTPGTDTITVFAESEVASVLITLTGSSAEITLQVSRLSILANGFDTTLVTASLVGRSENIYRVPIQFEATNGSFAGQRITFAQTNLEGKASVVLTSASSNNNIGATITATVEDFNASPPDGSGGELDRQKAMAARKARLHRTLSADAQATASVTYRGVSIAIEATPELIPGDGQATSEIRAILKEANNQAIPNTPVTFSAKLGSIPVQGTTDAAGVARVSLTSAVLPGATDRIIARYGPVLSDSVDVNYAAAVGRIVLTAGQPSFRASGVSGVDITAQVFGGTGSVAPNIEVLFTSDTGSVFPQRIVTDRDGKAVTRLTGPGSIADLVVTVHGEVVLNSIASIDPAPSTVSNPSPVPKDPGKFRSLLRAISEGQLLSDAAPIQASARSRPSDFTLGTEAIESSVAVLARGVQLRLSVDRDSLVARAGSQASLSAHVFETTSGNPVSGDTVRFATTLGSVPGSAILDSDGLATALFRAGEEVGSAVVTARYGSTHRADAEIELLQLTGSLSSRSDRPSIRAGGIDTVRITAQVLDPLGNPASGISVEFRADHLPGELVRSVTDAFGQAVYLAYSPATEIDSAFHVTATAGEFSSDIRIGVRALSRIISSDPDSLSAGSNRQVTVSFLAFESTTRRPVTGDTIWFSGSGGVVQPFAILDGEGVARTTFRVGQSPGEALVIGQLGSLHPDTTRLRLVEPVHNVAIRTGRRSILANGVDTTRVVATVTNILGQPAPDTWVNFAVTTGSISPESALTDSIGRVRVDFLSPADAVDGSARISATAIQQAFSPLPSPGITQPQKSAPVSFRSVRGFPTLGDAPSSVDKRNIDSDRPVDITIPKPAFPAVPFPQLDDVTDSVSVETRGVTLSLRASANAIRADGRSRAGINIQVSETTTGSAIANARLRIGATRGAIVAEGITRNDGTYVDSLTAGIAPGTCVVRASYGDLLTTTDTLQFTPDPARQNLIFQIEPAEATAGSGQQIDLSARVVDGDGAPSAGIGVTFKQEGARWVLIDPDEYREVVRYENTFRVDDRQNITSIRLLMQLRGVDNAQTRISLNRTVLDRVGLPQDELWGDYTLALPVESLIDGVNRIEIVGGEAGGISDRFSVAGVRIGLMGSHTISEEFTDENGWVQGSWNVSPVAEVVVLKALLTDAPARLLQHNLRLNPGNPAGIRLSTVADTLLANGAEETALLALVTDENGNPATSGLQIAFVTENGEIDPPETETLGDGTASAIYTSSTSQQDIDAEIVVSIGDVEGNWQLLLRGARLNLSIADGRMLADGGSQMEVRARLSTADGAAVSGRRIDFRTTRGSITPAVQTGNDGVAIALLTAADVADTARITATFGPEMSDSTSVIFVSLIDHIALSSDPGSIRADGLDSTVVTVTATDGLGHGAANVRIDLNSDRGRLSTHRLQTDNNGMATARLFGIASTEDDSLEIVATTSGGAHRDTLHVLVRGITMTTVSNSDSLAANGVATASVTSRLVETSTGNAVTAGRVTYSTDLGGISASANIDQNGLATATYTAAISTGLAEVRANYGNILTASDTILLVDRVAALELSATPELLLANGVQTAQIVTRVTDSWGEGAPQEQVTINFEGSGTVVPNVGHTDANGEFHAIARGLASSSDGRLLVTASVRGGRLAEMAAIELRGVTINLEADPSLIAGDGRSTSTLTARLRESSTGHPVAGDTVRFFTSAGTVAPYTLTDENGEAVANLRSEANSTIANVIATYGNRLADTTEVAFAGRYSYLELNLNRATLLADGVESVTATATLLDTLRRPVSGITLHFSAIDTVGSISSDSVVTNGQGMGSIVWLGEASLQDISGRLRVSAGSLSDTVSLALRGLTLDLTASSDTLPANNVAESRMTIQVRETERGNPVTGRQVAFRTNSGTIPAEASLDNNGRATVALQAPAQPGTATVTAEFGNALSAQHRVVFIPTVGSLSLTANRARIAGDGNDTTLIRVRLVDGANNPASGVRVQLEAVEGGEISPAQVTTDNDGLAQAVYTSFPSNVDSIIQISGIATGGAAAQTSLRIVGLTLSLSATPDILSANGRSTSQISASLFETVRHTPLTNQTVSFAADRGRITRSSQTDNDGIAVATFTSPAVAGDAEISAIYGDTLAMRISIACNASTPTTAQLAIEPTSVSVSGVGGDETATLSATILDATGQLVADNNDIVLTIFPSLGSRFSNDLDTIVVRTSNGIVEANVRSGDTPGTVRFRAWYHGTLLASGGDLTVRSGPPARVRVRPDLFTIHIPAGGLTAFPVSATVSDRFGNPVEDSTIVRFNLVPDTIANITGQGRTFGGVVSTPINPIDYPTGIWLTYADDMAGEIVWIHARSGDDIHDSARVVLPGALMGGEPDRMEIGFDSLSLEANGQSPSTMTINLIDADGRPVADMTEVTLTAALGIVQSPRFTAAGTATATYVAGRVAGLDTILVESGNISETVTMRLRPGAADRVVVEAERSRLRADSTDNTTITVAVHDRFDNPVRPGTLVLFSTTLGSIEPSSETDENGVARVLLTSGRRSGSAIVRAIAGDVDGITTVVFESGTPSNIVLVGVDNNSIGVRGSGQPETATLRFEVRDDRGVAVDSTHRAWVRFVLDGPPKIIDPDSSSVDSIAFLTPDSVQTDAVGQVAVTLHSGFFAGAVEVTGKIGNAISGRAIAIAIHGGPPDAAHFTIQSSRCVITGIFGTPADTTLIIAALGDRFSNPVTPGTVVRFSSTGGVIEGSAETDTLGLAQVVFRTSNPWPTQGLDSIFAQTVDYQDREIQAMETILVTGPTIASFDTLDGWVIPFGGYRDFTLTVADTFAHSLSAGTQVLIEASAVDARGNPLEGAILTGDATAQAVLLTECDFRTEFNVRLFNYISGLTPFDLAITATIESPNGNRHILTQGRGNAQVLSTELSRVVLSPAEIVADGVEGCLIRITLYDTLNIAIQGVPPDNIVIDVIGGEAVVTPPANLTDEFGRTVAVMVGRAVGEARVETRVNNQLLDDQPILNLIAGPPIAMSGRILDRRLVVGGDTSTVVVDITDANGNPTADGTVVTFEVDDGSITPASTTTVDGRATAILASGISTGTVQITIRASRRGVSIIGFVTNIEYTAGAPDQIVVSAPNYSVIVGSQSTISISAVDEFGNTVEGGNAIDLTLQPAGNGSIAPASVVTDTTGNATATFTAGTVANAQVRIIATTGNNVSGQSSQFTFNPGLPGRITLAADPRSQTVGGDIDITATVEDVYGNSVNDSTRVSFSRNPARGVLSPSAIRTSNGVANSLLTGVTVTGDIEVIAATSDISASTLVTYTVGPLNTVSVQAAPPAVVVGNSSTITATATDQYGNAISGLTLNFEITTNPGGNCQIQNVERATAANGTASTIFTAGQTTGSAIITVFFDEDGDNQLDQNEISGSAFVDIGQQ